MTDFGTILGTGWSVIQQIFHDFGATWIYKGTSAEETEKKVRSLNILFGVMILVGIVVMIIISVILVGFIIWAAVLIIFYDNNFKKEKGTMNKIYYLTGNAVAGVVYVPLFYIDLIRRRRLKKA